MYIKFTSKNKIMKINNGLIENKLFSLKAIRVSSLFFGIFAVTLMIISNLKVFEKLTPERPPSPFLKKIYPKSYNKEILKQVWIYSIFITLIMFLLALFYPSLPDGIFVGVSPAFGEFAFRKFLKKEQTKYLKETTIHSFGRILWTGIKGVSMYFFIAFFFLLSIIIFDIQLP